jgi:hypothetical protein
MKHLFNKFGKFEPNRIKNIDNNPNQLPEFWGPPPNYELNHEAAPWDRVHKTIIAPKFSMEFYQMIHN